MLSYLVSSIRLYCYLGNRFVDCYKLINYNIEFRRFYASVPLIADEKLKQASLPSPKRTMSMPETYLSRH